jgi:hypothetical protein
MPKSKKKIEVFDGTPKKDPKGGGHHKKIKNPSQPPVPIGDRPGPGGLFP